MILGARMISNPGECKKWAVVGVSNKLDPNFFRGKILKRVQEGLLVGNGGGKN